MTDVCKLPGPRNGVDLAQGMNERQHHLLAIGERRDGRGEVLDGSAKDVLTLSWIAGVLVAFVLRMVVPPLSNSVCASPDRVHCVVT